MAIPKPEPADWQKANAQQLRLGDAEVLQLLRDTYRRVDAELKSLKSRASANPTTRQAQLEQSRVRIMQEQAAIFDRLGDVVSARRLRAAARAARLDAAATAALLSRVGEGKAGELLYQAALGVSQRGIDAAMARMGLSRVPLSQRIYRTGVWMDGRLNRLINSVIASGPDVAKFAKAARDWFNPNVPGGTRYAALRLARTEINNAFHAETVKRSAAKPWVSEMVWNLSKSHPKPDICNKVQESSPYPAAAVPVRPHPQCMCYVTEKAIDEDDWIDRFFDGEFDQYLDGELAKQDAKLERTRREEAQPAPAPVSPLAAVPSEVVAEPAETIGRDPELAALVESLVRVEGDGRTAVVEELNVQAELTPKAIRRLGGVNKLTAAEEKALKAQFGKSAIGGYTSQSLTIGIAKEVFTDAYDRQFSKEVKSGFLSKCPHGHKHDGLKSFIAHEYGHHIEEVIRFGGNSAMKPVWKAVAEALGVKPPTLYDKTSIDRWVLKNKPLISKMVSKYGTESGGELLAEAWAEYSRDPNARPHIKAIGEAIREASEGKSRTPAPAPAPAPARALTGDEAQAVVPKGLFKRGSLTESQRKELKTYETGWFMVINQFLRGGEKIEDRDDQRTANTVAVIDTAMDESVLPKAIQTWRGMFRSKLLFGDRLDRDMTGFAWKELAYASTTSVESVADVFMLADDRQAPEFAKQNVKMIVNVPAGIRALQVSNSTQGSPTNGPQGEITLQRGLKWTVTKDHGYDPEKGYRLLEVTVSSEG